MRKNKGDDQLVKCKDTELMTMINELGILEETIREEWEKYDQASITT